MHRFASLKGLPRPPRGVIPALLSPETAWSWALHSTSLVMSVPKPDRLAPSSVVALAAVTLALLGACVMSLPTTMAPGGFTHDSGYIGVVARHLLAGRGMVNDALWFLPAHPAALPAPHVNANPGYPALIAAVSAVSGVSIMKAGFLISGAATALCAPMLGVLLLRLGVPLAVAALVPAVVVLSPVFAASATSMLPDALATLFILGSALCILGRVPAAICGGVLLALAWIVRSSSVLAVPAALACFAVADAPSRTRLRDAGRFLVSFAAPVVLYVLWRRFEFGDAYRSIDSSMLLQDYLARTRHDGDLLRVWTDIGPPVQIASLLRNEGWTLVTFVLTKAPSYALDVLRAASWGSEAAGLAIVASGGMLAWVVWREYRWRTLPLSLLLLAFFGVFAVRPVSVEVRYLLFPLLLLQTALLAAPWLPAVRSAPRGRLVVPLGALAFVIAVCDGPMQGYGIARDGRRESSEVRLALEECRRITGQQPRVLASGTPNYCAWASGGASVNIPSASWHDARCFLARYGVTRLVGDSAVLARRIPDMPGAGTERREIPGARRIVAVALVPAGAGDPSCLSDAARVVNARPMPDAGRPAVPAE